MTHWGGEIQKITSLKLRVARPRVDRLLRKFTYINFRTCGNAPWSQKRSTMPLSILNIGTNMAWFAILKWPILVYVFLLICPPRRVFHNANNFRNKDLIESDPRKSDYHVLLITSSANPLSQIIGFRVISIWKSVHHDVVSTLVISESS